MIQYRADIDGLRAIAILLVVIFHFDIFSSGKAGFIGVDIFFVISGFLITGIIFNALDKGTFSFRDFYYRRVRRLYPAMLVTLLIYLIIGYFAFLPELYRELAVEAALSQIYVVNIYFWQTVNYFGLHAESAPLLHMWSLAVEEQFYLLFPLLCVLIHRMRLRNVALWLAGLALASFILGVLAAGWKPEAAFYLLPTRAWEMLMGGVLALALQGRRLPVWLTQTAGPVGLILIVVALIVHTPATHVPGAYLLLPTFAAVALLIAGTHSRSPVARLLSTKPMIWFGKISYPLYLVHWPVLILGLNLAVDYTLAWRVGGLAFSILLAWAIYALVETPIRQGRTLQRPARFMTLAGSLTAVVIASSLFITQENGMPNRFGPQVSELLAYSHEGAEVNKTCQFGAKSLEAMCQLGSEGAPRSWLIFGDSHAKALSSAADIWLQVEGQAAAFAFYPNCMPVLRSGIAGCSSFVERTIDLAEASDEITDVLLISSWRQPLGEGMLFEGRWHGSGEAIAALEKNLLETVLRLQSAGKRVTIIDPLYAAPRNVPEALAKTESFGWTYPVDLPRADHKAQFAALWPVLDAAEAKGIARISLIEPLCDDVTCFGTLQGRPVFSDTNHLAYWMSPLMAGRLSTEIAR